LLTFYTQAQTVELKGVVKDSLQRSIPFVSIIATPVLKNVSIKFTMSDAEGKYKLGLINSETYSISVSHLGYKSRKFRVKANKNSLKNILLYENLNQLEEVVIELPIIVKKDTLIFNISKFVNGSERKLKDVLKKLPGINVNKNGEVTSNGKLVTHMLVEGKNFFGGNSKLAVENIPANAIKKIEVLNDYNEVALLKGLVDSDNLAMNIKLKEGKKKFLFGDIELGKGNKEFYNAQANLFFYNPEFNINFIGNTNNVGKKTFTYKDYLSFKGQGTPMFKNGNNDVDLDNMSSFMESQEVFKTRRHVAALNTSKSFSKKLDVTGYFIYAHSNTQKKELVSKQYTMPNQMYVEELRNKDALKNDVGIVNLKAIFKPNTLEYGRFNFQYKHSSSFIKSDLVSQINANEQFLEKTAKNKSYSISANLEGYKKLSKRHTFFLKSSLFFDKKNPQVNFTSDQILFPSVLDHLKQKRYGLFTNINKSNNAFSFSLKHYWVLNRAFQITTNAGHKKSTLDFMTRDMMLVGKKYANIDDSGFSNNLSFVLNSSFLALNVKYKIGKFQIKPSISVKKYHWNVGTETEVYRQKVVVLPSVVTTLNLSQTDKLKFSSGLQSTFSKGEYFAGKYYISAYNQAYQGNEFVEDELERLSSLYYTTTSFYKGFFLLAELSFIQKKRGLQTAVKTIGGDNYLSTLFVNDPSKGFRGDLIVNRRLKKVKFQLRARFNIINYKESINLIAVKNKSSNSSFKISVTTMKADFPNIEIGYKHGFSKYVSGKQSVDFITFEPYVSLNTKLNDKLNFELYYSFFLRKNNTIHKKDMNHKNDLVLSYQNPKSNWEFKFTLQNILNRESQNRNSFNGFIMSDTKTYTLPSIGVLALIYKL